MSDQKSIQISENTLKHLRKIDPKVDEALDFLINYRHLSNEEALAETKRRGISTKSLRLAMRGLKKGVAREEARQARIKALIKTDPDPDKSLKDVLNQGIKGAEVQILDKSVPENPAPHGRMTLQEMVDSANRLTPEEIAALPGEGKQILEILKTNPDRLYSFLTEKVNKELSATEKQEVMGKLLKTDPARIKVTEDPTPYRHEVVGNEEGTYRPVVIANDDRYINGQDWAGFCLKMKELWKGKNQKHAIFWQMMAIQMKNIQHFDFGEVTDLRIRKEAARAGKMMADGYLPLPYEAVAYHYRCKMDDGYVQPIITVAAVLSTDERGVQHIGAFDMVPPPPNWYEHKESKLSGKHPLMLNGAGEFHADKDHKSWWGHPLEFMSGKDPKMVSAEEATEMMVGLADGVGALTLMLSTKGIPIRREPAPEKLNKKRARSNKPPLPAITYVNAHHYHEAAERSEKGGTHASPVPHLRRAHTRTLKNGRKFRNGETTKVIAQMLVNCRSIAEITTPRNRYEVRT